MVTGVVSADIPLTLCISGSLKGQCLLGLMDPLGQRLARQNHAAPALKQSRIPEFRSSNERLSTDKETKQH
jgi:hypothetical protein